MKRPLKGPAGRRLEALDLKKERDALATRVKRDVSEDDLFSHLMYPDVFADFAKFEREFGDVSVLPTTAFFYGLKPARKSVSISSRARRCSSA
jgi:pyruvate carboxylase